MKLKDIPTSSKAIILTLSYKVPEITDFKKSAKVILKLNYNVLHDHPVYVF